MEYREDRVPKERRVPSRRRESEVLQVNLVSRVSQETGEPQEPQALAPRGPLERRVFRGCRGGQDPPEHQELKVSQVKRWQRGASQDPEDRMENQVFQGAQVTQERPDNLVSLGYQEAKETQAFQALDYQAPLELKDSQAPLASQVAQEEEADLGWTACLASLDSLEPRENLGSVLQVFRVPPASLDPKDFPDLKEIPVSPATPVNLDDQALTAARDLKVTQVSLVSPELVAPQAPLPSGARAPPDPLGPPEQQEPPDSRE